MKITLWRPRMMIAGLAMALMLMLAALVPLIAQPADTPPTTTKPREFICPEPLTGFTCCPDAPRSCLDAPDYPFTVDPGSDMQGLVELIQLNSNHFSLEDAKTAGVPKPSEVIQTPGFWQSFVPALIPSIGVGVGGGREGRGGNPCSQGRRTDSQGGVILPIPVPRAADAPTGHTQSPDADSVAGAWLSGFLEGLEVGARDLANQFTFGFMRDQLIKTDAQTAGVPKPSEEIRKVEEKSYRAGGSP